MRGLILLTLLTLAAIASGQGGKHNKNPSHDKININANKNPFPNMKSSVLGSIHHLSKPYGTAFDHVPHAKPSPTKSADGFGENFNKKLHWAEQHNTAKDPVPKDVIATGSPAAAAAVRKARASSASKEEAVDGYLIGTKKPRKTEG